MDLMIKIITQLLRMIRNRVLIRKDNLKKIMIHNSWIKWQMSKVITIITQEF